jgi:hypothetical protein
MIGPFSSFGDNRSNHAFETKTFGSTNEPMTNKNKCSLLGGMGQSQFGMVHCGFRDLDSGFKTRQQEQISHDLYGNIFDESEFEDFNGTNICDGKISLGLKLNVIQKNQSYIQAYYADEGVNFLNAFRQIDLGESGDIPTSYSLIYNFDKGKFPEQPVSVYYTEKFGVMFGCSKY